MRADNLNIGYGGKAVVEGISFETSPGEMILLCGANGSGKSTLLKTLAGITPALSGSIEGNDQAVLLPGKIEKVRGFSGREFMSAANFRDTGIFGLPSESLKKRMDNAASILDIADLLDRDISTLSEGEFQKVCIASALCHCGGILLLDEPLAFLDVEGRILVLEALKKICSEGITVIFSSHDLSDSLRYSSRTFGIDKGHAFLDSASENDVVLRCFNIVTLK